MQTFIFYVAIPLNSVESNQIDDLQMNHTVLICLDYYLVNNENYRQ